MRRLLLCCLMMVPIAAWGQLHVLHVAPASHSLGVAPGEAITIAFDHPMAASAFEATTLAVFGRWSGPVDATLALEDDGKRLVIRPERPFFAGERVTVSLARHLTAENGETLKHGFAWQFWTRTRPAMMDLRETARLQVRTPEEQRAGTWIQTYGAYAGDFNGDGFSDFAVPNERPNNEQGDVRLFLNDGQGGYAESTIYPTPGGARPSTNEGADFDLDGHLDFAVGSSRNDVVSVFFGDGTGRLLGPTTYRTADGVRGLTVLDANGDGYADIATASRAAGQVSILLNDGTGAFIPGETYRFTGATAIEAADANGDGIFDLFVATRRENPAAGRMILLLGDGAGGFTLQDQVPVGGRAWMIATGDLDRDGLVDVVSANSDSDNVAVIFGEPGGHLGSAVVYPTGGFDLAIDLGDLDGDGDLDLVTSNFNGGDWTIYLNQGDGRFGNRRALAARRAGSCAVLHDRNNDGTLDVTAIDELSDELFLFTNQPLSTSIDIPPTFAFAVDPAYPNPFREATTLRFHLDAAVPLRVAIYDVLGRRVRHLYDGLGLPGETLLSWDGHDDAGVRLPAGLYLARLAAPGLHRTEMLVRQ